MPIKLKLKNTTDKPITLGSEDSAITIANGKEGEVPLEMLRSAEVVDHFAAARLTLSKKALEGLGDAERAEATHVLTDLILRAAPRLLAHHGELATSLANLESLRDRYNELHGTAVKLLTSAKSLAPAATAVLQTTDLLSATEDDLVAAAEKALAKHLESKPDDLQKWYVEHKQLEADYTKAVAARDAARSAVAKQLDATKAELAAAAAAFGKADPKKDVGSAVTWG